MKIFIYDKEPSSNTSKDKYKNKNHYKSQNMFFLLYQLDVLKTVIISCHIYELNILVQKHKTFNVGFFMYSVKSQMFDRIKHNKYINLTTKRLAVKQKFVNCKPTL